jgi:hypothetical protein
MAHRPKQQYSEGQKKKSEVEYNEQRRAQGKEMRQEAKWQLGANAVCTAGR